ncbi:MAG TPA: flagellar motor protein MotB [Polyangiaceae bacterium]
MRSALALFLVLALAGCGIPKSQYDAAVADEQKKARDQKDADDKQLAEMRARVAELETKQTDEQTRAELEELKAQKVAADARAKLFDDFIKKFQKMIDAGKLDITMRRGQIVLALATDVLFDQGKTEIKPEGKTALDEVAAALKGISGRRFQVAGHTDTFPIKTKEFPSNWELSTARAVSVVKLLVGAGVKAEALSAAGYAEFDPAQSNASDRGRSKNRRIEIVLVPNIEELVKMPELKPATTKPAVATPPKK